MIRYRENRVWLQPLNASRWIQLDPVPCVLEWDEVAFDPVAKTCRVEYRIAQRVLVHVDAVTTEEPEYFVPGAGSQTFAHMMSPFHPGFELWIQMETDSKVGDRHLLVTSPDGHVSYTDPMGSDIEDDGHLLFGMMHDTPSPSEIHSLRTLCRYVPSPREWVRPHFDHVVHVHPFQCLHDPVDMVLHVHGKSLYVHVVDVYSALSDSQSVLVDAFHNVLTTFIMGRYDLFQPTFFRQYSLHEGLRSVITFHFELENGDVNCKGIFPATLQVNLGHTGWDAWTPWVQQKMGPLYDSESSLAQLFGLMQVQCDSRITHLLNTKMTTEWYSSPQPFDFSYIQGLLLGRVSFCQPLMDVSGIVSHFLMANACFVHLNHLLIYIRIRKNALGNGIRYQQDRIIRYQHDQGIRQWLASVVQVTPTIVRVRLIHGGVYAIDRSRLPPVNEKDLIVLRNPIFHPTFLTVTWPEQRGMLPL